MKSDEGLRHHFLHCQLITAGSQERGTYLEGKLSIFTATALDNSGNVSAASIQSLPKHPKDTSGYGHRNGSLKHKNILVRNTCFLGLRSRSQEPGRLGKPVGGGGSGFPDSPFSPWLGGRRGPPPVTALKLSTEGTRGRKATFLNKERVEKVDLVRPG